MNYFKLSLSFVCALGLAACASTTNNVTADATAKSGDKKTMTETIGTHEKVKYSDGIKEMVNAQGEIQIEGNKDIVCTQTRKTGSRIGKARVCMTKVEYDEQRRIQKDMARSRDNVSPGIGSGE